MFMRDQLTWVFIETRFQLISLAKVAGIFGCVKLYYPKEKSL